MKGVCLMSLAQIPSKPRLSAIAEELKTDYVEQKRELLARRVCHLRKQPPCAFMQIHLFAPQAKQLKQTISLEFKFQSQLEITEVVLQSIQQQWCCFLNRRGNKACSLGIQNGYSVTTPRCMFRAQCHNYFLRHNYSTTFREQRRSSKTKAQNQNC